MKCLALFASLRELFATHAVDLPPCGRKVVQERMLQGGTAQSQLHVYTRSLLCSSARTLHTPQLIVRRIMAPSLKSAFSHWSWDQKSHIGRNRIFLGCGPKSRPRPDSSFLLGPWSVSMRDSATLGPAVPPGLGMSAGGARGCGSLSPIRA